jgi:hypothetical protein
MNFTPRTAAGLAWLTSATLLLPIPFGFTPEPGVMITVPVFIALGIGGWTGHRASTKATIPISLLLAVWLAFACRFNVHLGRAFVVAATLGSASFLSAVTGLVAYWALRKQDRSPAKPSPRSPLLTQPGTDQ